MQRVEDDDDESSMNGTEFVQI